MKTSLSHLPQTKQDQILQVMEIIREVAKPEKIILFGSYAKGNYVEHRYTGKDGIIYEYISDFDFLVVTQHNFIKDYELEDIIASKTQQYKTPVNLQIHEIDYINEGLEFGQYFFTDIFKEGILLFDKNNLQFSLPKELSAAEMQIVSQRYFDTWFERQREFYIDAENAYERNSYKKSLFELHQATESIYSAILLIFTGYKPKTHSLFKLRKYSKSLSEELYLIFPIENNKKEKQLFDLLKSGYIDARYKDDFQVAKDDIIILLDRIKKMNIIALSICANQIV